MQVKIIQEKDIVLVAGAVIVRQSLGTVKKVVLMTWEDETGCANFSVMPNKVFVYSLEIFDGSRLTKNLIGDH